ncbi:thiamine-binding protein [Pediococcus pentosaceus]|uniref:thiamine-binding protein n=1 Tax=Pediococcus pentosaceus TaxID=1255 RepID=UPI001330FF9D|nr:thiamine-binding protein [Pediococcus pentosaceus]KAF0506817.1 thiamine-binding protein [Pediococcus pentosaceus]MBF7139253.1 thiamine-binding protein [Pediococcus pentosaceus]MCM6820945.1 thiamine-binding protein [Pediococcus pentosaceus]
MNTSVAIQVLPIMEDEKKLVAAVDQAIKYIKSTGVNYQVGAFETTLEGDYDQLMEIVKNITKITADAGAPQVMSYVKINYKPEGQVLSIHEKTNKYQH